MPQPTPGAVHVDRPLTNISIAYMQEADSFIARRVAPNVPVQKQSDLYFKYPRGFFMRDQMEKRGPASESAGSGYNVETDSYRCDVWALHIDVDDQTRSNADAPLAPDTDATQFLSQQALIRREGIFAETALASGVWTHERTGSNSTPSTDTQFLQWDDSTSTPIEDVRAWRRTVQRATGFLPNTLVLGPDVEDALMDHPDIVDRIKYGQQNSNVANVNMQVLSALFNIPNVMSMEGLKNSADEGQTDSIDFINAKDAFLAYIEPSPGLRKPSAMYTMVWSGFIGAGGDGQRMKSFRMEALSADRMEIEMAIDMKVVAPDLGLFINDAVA